MSRDEAKYLLRAYHLGGQDAQDPQFQEALELSKRDPALASWFASERAIDTRLSEKFRSFPVVPDLKTQLLASRQVIPLRPWWQRPVWVSAAACMASLLVFVGWLFHSAAPPQFAAFREYVTDTTAKLDHLDLTSTNLVDVRRWLVAQNAPSDFLVPAGLTGRPSVGCRKFNWKGQPVSLVCFKIDNLGTVHLFVINRSTLNNAPAATTPEFAMSNQGIATASWSNNRCIYVLASKQDGRELKRLL